MGVKERTGVRGSSCLVLARDLSLERTADSTFFFGASAWKFEGDREHEVECDKFVGTGWGSQRSLLGCGIGFTWIDIISKFELGSHPFEKGLL